MRKRTSIKNNEETNKNTSDKVQELSKSESDVQIYKAFKLLAPHYDVFHDIISLGYHRIWRNRLITLLNPTENMKLIDMAGGTGDIAFRFLDYIKKYNLKSCHVTVCDINDHMLQAGESGKKALTYDPSLISWVLDDAEKLTFPDESFNTYTIAFGIRNCTHPIKVIREAYRILQPGGMFLCLEISHAENRILQWLFDFYFNKGLGLAEYVLNRNTEIMHCVTKAFREFPNKEGLKRMLEEVGFQNVAYESLSFGIVAIHTAIKP